MRGLVIATLSVGLLFASARAAAETDADTNLGGEKAKPWSRGVSPETRAKANALFLRGNEQFTADRHAEALKLYVEALSLWKHPRIHLNAAASCVELDRLLDGASHAGEAGKYRDDLDADDRRKLAKIDAVIEESTAVVVVESGQKGAVVTIDGDQVLVGPGKARHRVLPGKHELVARHDGLEPESRQLDIKAGEEVSARPVLFVVDTEWRWAKWQPWTLAGLGAAVGLAGVPLLLSARAKRDERREFEMENCTGGGTCGDDADGNPTPEKQTILDLDASADRRTVFANAAFISGGVILAAGLTLAILNRPTQVKRPADDDDFQATLWADEDLIGARFSVRF